MNIIKSIVVLCILITLIIFATITVIRTIKKCINREHSPLRIVMTILLVLFTSLFVVFLSDYVYPFERNIDPVLVAEYDVPEEYLLAYPGQKHWCGAYEKYGLYAESFNFDTDSKVSMYGFEWPDMDFENYSYIITYGQKIESLSYNVWDTIDLPVRTGAKVGHMILDDTFAPEKVYVYQIPKMRIDNDRNDLDSQWD